jgi:hypothetical protein
MGLENSLVPKKGLEPPHPCEYVDLNHARLPIPPLRQIRKTMGKAEPHRIERNYISIETNRRRIVKRDYWLLARSMSRISRLIFAASRAPVSIIPAQRFEVSSSCDWFSK